MAECVVLKPLADFIRRDHVRNLKSSRLMFFFEWAWVLDGGKREVVDIQSEKR